MSTHRITQAEPRRWAMFVILLVGAFLPPLDFFIVNVALPAIQSELGASFSAEQLVISSYAAVYAVTLITGGRLGDIYGRGRMFFLGLIGFAAASLLCGLAWSPWVLIIGRILQGATAAIMAPQALASVQAIFPEAEKPFALSLYGAVFGLASVIGQVSGGILISANLFGLGWRTIFLVNLPVALLVILFGVPLLKETRAQSAQRLDPVGTLLTTVMLSAVIVPLTEGREAGWPWWTWLSLLAFPLLARLLWRYEDRLSQHGGSPLLNPAVLCAPGLGQGLAMPTLVRMVTGRVAPAFSGMIAGVTSSALQLSTALSVAVIGGLFYSMLDNGKSAANITQAFIVALAAMSLCLAAGAGLSFRLLRRSSEWDRR